MSRSYKKYSKKDENVKGINLTFTSNSNLLADGSKFLVDKAKGFITKSSLTSQLTSLYFQLGKMVYFDYENNTDNSKEITRCLKKIRNIKKQLDQE